MTLQDKSQDKINNCRSLIKINWATTQDLKKKQGIVYRIVNIITGECYIGCTISEFWNRYSGNWIKNTENPLLRNSANKYGKENFRIQILSSGTKSRKILFALEAYFANIYKCYINQNGFNIVKCGGEMPITKTRSGALKNTKGEIFNFTNIRQFCRDQNLKRAGIQKVLNKRLKRSQGWALPETNLEDLKNYQQKYNSKSYIFKNPSGEEILITNLREFCKSNGLYMDAMKRVRKGTRKHHKKWTFIKIYNNPLKLKKIKSPLGKIIKINNIEEFCRLQNLNVAAFRDVTYGKRKNYKGWTKA